MIDPPQKALLLELEPAKATIQGYSFTSVETPPTIRVLLFTRPQLQSPVGGSVGAGVTGDPPGEHQLIPDISLLIQLNWLVTLA